MEQGGTSVTIVAGAKELKFATRVRICRPLPEVYRAVIEPQWLNRYFTQTATPLRVGEDAWWTWSGGEKTRVHVSEMDENRKLAFTWKAQKVDYETTVEFTFERDKDHHTVVEVVERGFHPDAQGLLISYDHRGGWEHMLMCLKARLEHDIDLR